MPEATPVGVARHLAAFSASAARPMRIHIVMIGLMVAMVVMMSDDDDDDDDDDEIIADCFFFRLISDFCVNRTAI